MKRRKSLGSQGLMSLPAESIEGRASPYLAAVNELSLALGIIKAGNEL